MIKWVQKLKGLVTYIVLHINLLNSVVMSSSWIFPSWAKPSWKVSEPSRAVLGNSIFELKPRRILFWYIAFLALFFLLGVHFKKKKYYSPQTKPKNAGENKEKKSEWQKMPIFRYLSWFFFQAEQKRSPAEPNRAEIKLWLE